MIRTLIIEDEQNARATLTKMLKLVHTDIEIIGQVGKVQDALAFVEKEDVELIFLDIELEDGTGLDFLKQLKHIDFKIIFTTAYNQFAIKASKFSAIDYLLKPIDPFALKDAVDRAMQLIHREQEYQKLVAVLKSNLKEIDKK